MKHSFRKRIQDITAGGSDYEDSASDVDSSSSRVKRRSLILAPETQDNESQPIDEDVEFSSVPFSVDAERTSIERKKFMERNPATMYLTKDMLSQCVRERSERAFKTAFPCKPSGISLKANLKVSSAEQHCCSKCHAVRPDNATGTVSYFIRPQLPANDIRLYCVVYLCFSFLASSMQAILSECLCRMPCSLPSC